MGEAYPASQAQQSIWLAQQRNPRSTAFNIVRAWRLEGDLDDRRLLAAVDAVMSADECLRTTYQMSPAGLEAVVRTSWDPPDADSGHLDEADRAIEAERRREWDLEAGPVARWRLSRLGSARVLVFSAHHIAVDGDSLAVIGKQLGAAYLGRTLVHAAAYAEFARREPARRRPGDLDYWHRVLTGANPLPSQAGPPAGGASSVPLSVADLARPLDDMTRRLRVSSFAVLAAVLADVLGQAPGRSGTVLALPYSGRFAPRYRETVGNFVSVLPLVLRASADPAAAIAQAQESLWDAMEHDGVPYAEVLADWRSSTSAAPDAGFAAAYLDIRPSAVSLDLAGIRCTDITPAAETVRFPVEWHLRRDARQGLAGRLLYGPTVTRDQALDLAAATAGTLAAWTRTILRGPEARSLHVPGGTTGTPLTTIVAQNMGDMLGRAEFGPDDDFFLAGGHSLAAARLSAALSGATGRRVPVSLVFDEPTPARLAAALDRDQHHAADLGRVLSEFALPDGLPVAWRRPSDSSAAVVTGATGLLGRYVVARLLDRGCSRVTALVRAPDDERARARLRASMADAGLWEARHEDRIQVVAADITRPRCGLTRTGWERLGDGLSLIVHCAADTNPYLSCGQLAPANVGGSREVTLLAARTGAFLNLVSSISVAPVEGNQVRPGEPLAGNRNVLDSPDVAGAPGYVQTKWLAESLFEQAANLGVSGTVTRVARVTGDSRTGWYNVSSTLARLVQAAIRAGTVSDLELYDLWTPVDTAAEHIAAGTIDSRAPVTMLPYARVPLSRLWDSLREAGITLKQVPHEEWLAVLDGDPSASWAVPMARQWASPERSHIIGRGLAEAEAPGLALSNKTLSRFADQLSAQGPGD